MVQPVQEKKKSIENWHTLSPQQVLERLKVAETA